MVYDQTTIVRADNQPTRNGHFDDVSKCFMGLNLVVYVMVIKNRGTCLPRVFFHGMFRILMCLYIDAHAQALLSTESCIMI